MELKVKYFNNFIASGYKSDGFFSVKIKYIALVIVFSTHKMALPAFRLFAISFRLLKWNISIIKL